MKNERGLTYWVFTWLLLTLLGINTCFTWLAYQDHLGQVERIEERQAAYEEHAQQLQAVRASEYRVITSARDGYHTDAYESSVDRIAEQQLIAAEYQLLLLQIIARQNAEIIELMLLAGP